MYLQHCMEYSSTYLGQTRLGHFFESFKLPPWEAPVIIAEDHKFYFLSFLSMATVLSLALC